MPTVDGEQVRVGALDVPEDVGGRGAPVVQAQAPQGEVAEQVVDRRFVTAPWAPRSPDPWVGNRLHNAYLLTAVRGQRGQECGEVLDRRRRPRGGIEHGEQRHVGGMTDRGT